MGMQCIPHLVLLRNVIMMNLARMGPTREKGDGGNYFQPSCMLVNFKSLRPLLLSVPFYFFASERSLKKS
jgi:hypothetical protein